MPAPGRPSALALMDGNGIIERPNLGSLRLDFPQQNEMSEEERRREQYLQLSVSNGKLTFHKTNEEYPFDSSALEDLGPIGSGSFGTVYKMRHKATGREIAVKTIRCTSINAQEQQRLLREQKTIMNSNNDNIVEFHGAIFNEGDCWICMELMDVNLDRLYRYVYNTINSSFPENVIGHIAVSTIDALDYLKQTLKVIHRDVKPSNILCNRRGEVKLCDFGICGELEDSLVKTHDAGCQPYLAPERIASPSRRYDVRSDVWSLGITLYEISKGRFPYNQWNSIFDQVSEVVNGNPPMLDASSNFTVALVKFVNACLTKDEKSRPKYPELKKMDFYVRYHQNASISEEGRRLVGEYCSACADA